MSSSSAPSSGIIWIPAEAEQLYRNRIVQAIHFSAYDAHDIDDPPNRMTNHWVMFLQIGANASIRVNPSPAPMTNRLQLKVEPKPYSNTQGSLLSTTLVPAQGLTVHHILALIMNQSLDKYTFDADGNGCRYWVIQFLARLLSTQGWIPEAGRANAQQTLGLLNRTWTRDNSGQVIPHPRGTGPNPGSFN